jgi:hypothetical protein
MNETKNPILDDGLQRLTNDSIRDNKKVHQNTIDIPLWQITLIAYGVGVGFGFGFMQGIQIFNWMYSGVK